MFKRVRGFTIVELVVVIVVLGILAAITTVGLVRYQMTSRDAQRSARATILTESLEKYFDKNGEYPGCQAVTGTPHDVTDAVFPGLDPEVLLTPSHAPSETNSIKCNDLTTTQDPDIFAYVGDDSDTCAEGDACLRWTFKYKEEASSSVKEIISRRDADTPTAGAPTVTGTVVGYTGLQLKWNKVLQAEGYAIDFSSTDDFSADVTTIRTATNSRTLTAADGITPGSTYFIRVAGIILGSSGEYSTAINLSTSDRPTITASVSNFTTIKATWNGDPIATSYSVQISASPTFNPLLKSVSVTGTTYSFTAADGVAESSTYYVRVQGLSPSGNSGYSLPDDAQTGNSAAPTLAAGTVGTTSASLSWSSISAATAYTLQRSTNQSTWTTISTANVTSYTNTGLTAGQTYYYRVQSNNNTTTWSNTVKIITTINAPGLPTVTAGTDATKKYTWTGASCTAGTTPQYRYAFTSNATGSTVTGAWSAATTATSITNSSATSRGVRYGIYVQQRCVTSAATGSWGGSSTHQSFVVPVVHIILTGAAAKIDSSKYPTFEYTDFGSTSCGSGVTFQSHLDASWNDADYVEEQGWTTRSLTSPSSTKLTRTLPDGQYIKWRPKTRCVNLTTGTAIDADGAGNVAAKYFFGLIYARYSQNNSYNISCQIISTYPQTYCAGGYTVDGATSNSNYKTCAARSSYPDNSAGNQTRWSALLKIGANPPCWK